MPLVAVHPQSLSSTALFSSSPTRLYYRDDKHEEESSEGGEKQKKEPQQQQQNQQQQQQQNQQSQQQSQQQQHQSAPPRAVWTIPVLGPFPGQAPLVLGADMTLHPPTPMQWQALEEAVLIHQQHISSSSSSSSSSATVHMSKNTVSCVGDDDDKSDHHDNDDSTLSSCCCSSAAGIDAAPLVAILDDATGSNPNGMLQVVHGSPGGRSIRARYATICAVVGMSTKNHHHDKGDDDGDDDEESCANNNNGMHGWRQTPAEQASIVDRTIRLVAIGRAAVHSFVYQVPTSRLQDTMDEEGHLILTEKNMKSEDSTDHEDDDDDIDDTVPPLPTNIVMAHFQLITDRAETSSQPNSAAAAAILPSRHASPMHALSKMSALSHQIAYLHHDRRQLVAGLQAAQARLQQRAPQPQRPREKHEQPEQEQQQEQQQQEENTASIVFEEELFDYDGIGALFAQKEMIATTNDDENDNADPVILRDFLAEFGVPASSSSSSSSSTSTTTKEEEEDVRVDLSDTENDDNELLLDPTVVGVSRSDENEESTIAVGTEPILEEQGEPVISLVASLENYGMGYSASSISSIPELTQAWMEQLAPYYSPTRQQSEEHYYEVLSFVALRSMDAYLEAPHFAWAVQCTNTMERLQVIQEWMTSHVRLLKEEARRMSQQLLECGEECTDLF